MVPLTSQNAQAFVQTCAAIRDAKSQAEADNAIATLKAKMPENFELQEARLGFVQFIDLDGDTWQVSQDPEQVDKHAYSRLFAGDPPALEGDQLSFEDYCISLLAIL